MTVFRGLVACLIAGLCGLIAVAFTPSPERAATPSAPPPPVSDALSVVPLQPPSTAAAVLERSPFDPERKAYARGEPAAATPAVDIRITGISSRGDQRRASLAIDGVSQTVSVGDETLAGVVLAIEADAVVFAGSPPRRVTF